MSSGVQAKYEVLACREFCSTEWVVWCGKEEGEGRREGKRKAVMDGWRSSVGGPWVVAG